RPAAVERGLRVRNRHTILCCQRAACLGDGTVWWTERQRLRGPTARGYPVAHEPGLRFLSQPAAPRDLGDDRHLTGGEASQGGGRGRDRPRRRGARLPDAVDPRGRRGSRDPRREDALPGERGDPRAARRGREAPVAALGRPAGERRQHRGIERVEAVALQRVLHLVRAGGRRGHPGAGVGVVPADRDRKSTRLNSSHVSISYAVFCLKKKKTHVSEELSYTNKKELKSTIMHGIDDI